MNPKPSIKPRKLPSQARSRDTVDALLEATARVLVTDGFDKASTNHIAATAGVSIGSLYQYFPSKEALVGAVIDRHMEEMTDLVRDGFESVTDKPLGVAVGELVASMIEAHALNPKLHQVLAENTGRVGRRANLAAIDNENIRLVRAYLEDRRDDIAVAKIDLAAVICVTVVEALTHASVIHNPKLITGDNRRSFVDEITTMLVNYLTRPRIAF